MSERVKFIGMCLGGGRTMAGLCSEFGISRKTGYKWLNRYRQSSLEGLLEQSRAPHHHPNETDPDTEFRLVAARKVHPTWGPKKLLWKLAQEGHPQRLPSSSTAWAILKRHGLVEQRRRRRPLESSSAPEWTARAPNEVWCADFKGEFKTLDGQYCFPLTVSDGFSRYLLSCHALQNTRVDGARPVFERAFREYGLPQRLRTDNGSPFASIGLARLTRLSVWMIKLGIGLERIQPGHPEQNGRHERMHRTLKRETTLPPALDLKAQQRRFDRFQQEYNEERPHEALGQRPPGWVYHPSSRPFPQRIEPYDYPLHYQVRKVDSSGKFTFRMHAIYSNECLAGELIGLVEVHDRIWRVYFRDRELGIIDEATFRKRRRIGHGLVLPMCPI